MNYKLLFLIEINYFRIILLSYCQFKKIFNLYNYYIIKLFTLAGLSMIR